MILIPLTLYNSRLRESDIYSSWQIKEKKKKQAAKGR